MANRTYQDYLATLAKRESGGQADPYQAVNKHGYLGKYQMGKLALIDAGFYQKDGSSNNDFHDHKWTGKHGVHSREDFLNSPEAQEAAIRSYNRAQWGHIRNKGLDAHLGRQYGDGPTLTPSGLLAGAHLVGVGNLAKYLNSEGKVVPRDGNKVPITRYIEAMAGYDVPVSRPRQAKAKGAHQQHQDSQLSQALPADRPHERPVKVRKPGADTQEPGHAVLAYALEHFSKGYEYGRSDKQWNNRSPNARTDHSRDGRDIDGDGLRGIDCSSLVYKALRGAGFELPGKTLVTSQLFTKRGGPNDFAEKYFDVLTREQGYAKDYQPGDIMMFASRMGEGRHVGIFQGYDAKGQMQFFGSQVSTGPATVTMRRGGDWDGKAQIFLGALRPKAEHFRSIKQDGDTAEPQVGAHQKPADHQARGKRATPSEQAGQAPDAIEHLWNLRYKHLGADAVPDAIQSLSRKVQQACSAFDALQTARVTHYLADRAEKAQLPLQAIGEVLREAHGGRDLLHAIHQNRSLVASADINKALQAALEPALSLNPTIQPTQQVATRSSH